MPDLDEPDAGAVDLRMPLLAAAGWAGGLVAAASPGLFLGLLWAGMLGWPLLRGRGGARTLVAVVLVAAAVGGSLLVRADVARHGPVARLGAEHAVVRVVLTVTSDPVPREGRYASYVLVRGVVREVTGRGRTDRTRAPVLVLADESWRRVRLGSLVRATGRLAPPEDTGPGEPTAVLTTSGAPLLLEEAGPLWRAADAVRRSLRDSVAGRPADPRALVPALVVGDDAGLSEERQEEFRATGLTHLLAVSGTNLTLVVGFLLLAGRWCGVRGRGLPVLGAFGIVAFVLVARTEPSVVRAAAMGTVGLVAMGSNGGRRAARALGVAVLVLLLVDPALVRSVGFALSVVATAGIVFLAPGWRDALDRWLPRPVAEAVAVPLAAQLACTPLVAAISGQVSLVAVAANLAAAAAVGPATVLGLLGGVVGVLLPPVGAVFGWAASWCAAWILAVAAQGARLPTAAVPWGTGGWALTLLTLGCLLLALALPRLLGRPATGVGCAALTAVVVLVPVPTPGWPPDDWALVACDVGQGDALVLAAGTGAAVVVDAGPDPGAVDRCLDRLEVSTAPLVVLTHFHADHVDGLAGVLDGRSVGEVVVTTRGDPAEGARQVLATAAGRATVRVASYGEAWRVGELTLQVLGPIPGPVTGDGPNNASVVLLAEVRGVRFLLAGDVEPEAQAALARAWPGLAVDVLKVPHHGSRHQDLGWLLGLGARLAVVSVGADNDYGHPSADTLAPLAAAGLTVARTDDAGDVAVLARDGEVRLATRD